MPAFLVIILVGASLLFAVGIWLLVLWILARASGWARLAEQFYFPEPFAGRILRFQSARIRQANYNGCLQLGVSAEGLYLVPFPLFKPFHQPLLIPWTGIQVERLKKFLFKGYRLSFPGCPGVSVDFPAWTFEKVMQNLKEHTDYRPEAGLAAPRSAEPSEDDESDPRKEIRDKAPGNATPAEGEFGHLLGGYTTAEAPRLLETLRERGVPFELDMDDRTNQSDRHTSYGWNSGVKVWVKPADQRVAERIQAEVFDIQT